MPTAVPMPRRLAADGCPGALQVHQAADGGLARIRVPGGVVSLTQLATLRDCAGELGDGHLELTSRGNLQIRGLAAETTLAGRLASVGLLPSATHERVRNVLASPLGDVRSQVAALDRALCADPALADLPGRFLFAIDDGHDVSGLGADVTVMLGADRVPVLLAGVDSGLRVAPDHAVPALLEAARGFLAERAAQASAAWRLSELYDGVARVAARVSDVLDLATGAGQDIPAAALEPGTAGPIGVLPQRDGRYAVGVVAPLGRLTVAQLARVGALASEEIIVTPWRGIVLPNLGSSDAEAALAALAAAGLVTDPASPWATATACTGLPGCAKSRADVRADASTALDLTTPASGLLPVHWVGCERRCGRPAGAHVEVLATAEGYQVAAAGYRVGAVADAGYPVAGESSGPDALSAIVAAARRNNA